jgi:putative transposase
VIRDERDLANHFHYIHYNPVKHGNVTKPENYAHSSFREYLKRGWYEMGWGHTEPEAVKGLDFE